MGLIYKASFPDVSIFHSFDEHPNQSDFQMHVHNNNELFLFVSGKATYLVEGNEYPLSPGSLILLRGAESHAINFLADGPYERYAINFSSALLSSIDPELRLLAPFYNRPLGVGNLYTPDELPCESAISRFTAMCKEPSDSYEAKISILSNLLPLLSDLCHAQNSRSNESKTKKEISSDMVNYIISASQAERIFKKATHSSVWRYVVVKRLAAARSKIEAGASAYTACNECGFGDYSAFYRAYVKEYKIPPNSSK